MGPRGRRILWISASVAIVPVTAVASWWLVGDVSTVDDRYASYLFGPPDMAVRTQRALGVVASVLVIAYVAAATVAARRSNSRDTYLGAAVCLVAMGGLAGLFGRILTAGVDGANIGGGFVILFGTPTLFVLGLLAVALARITDRRRAAETAAGDRARHTLVDVLTIAVAIAVVGVFVAGIVRITNPDPHAVDGAGLGRVAARRIRTVERSGALAAPPGTAVATTPRCGDSTLPSADYTFTNVAASTPVADRLTEQLRAAGWEIGELLDGFRDYRKLFRPWPARLGMIQKTADGNSVTLHLDVGADPDTDCGAYLSRFSGATR